MALISMIIYDQIGHLYHDITFTTKHCTIEKCPFHIVIDTFSQISTRHFDGCYNFYKRIYVL